jgi:hypothetical protein
MILTFKLYILKIKFEETILQFIYNSRMEFPYNCEKLLGADAEGFAIIDGKKGSS